MTGGTPEVRRSQASIGELLSGVTRDVSVLLRKELELAKAELRQDARNAGQAGGMLGGAALAGFMVLVFASIALWWGLGAVIPRGWSALVVAVLWAAVAAILAVTGRRRMKQAQQGLPRTTQTAREIPDALRGR